MLKPEASDPHTIRLAALSGEWEGLTKTWLDPNGKPDESTSIARIKPILGGLFALQEYESSISGRKFSGMIIYGFDTHRRIYTTVWIDSFHMGSEVMFSEGSPESSAEVISVLGHYTDHASRQVWGWRSIVECLDPDHMKFSSFNISPDGNEVRAIETIYARRHQAGYD